jgi:hypothetical protein
LGGQFQPAPGGQFGPACGGQFDRVLQSCAQNSPDSIIKIFFNKYEIEKKSAFEYLFSTNKYLSNAEERSEELSKQLKDKAKLLGDYNGYEFIGKKAVGNSLVLYSYLLKFEREPVRYEFIFYNARNNWTILNFTSDTDLESELKKAAQIPFLY